MINIHYWTPDKWVSRITEAAKYKKEPELAPGYYSIKFGKSWVIFCSDKEPKQTKSKGSIQRMSLRQNPAPVFDDPDQERRFYEFAKDSIKQTANQDLTFDQIKALLNDPKTGNIITGMLALSLDLRRKNRAFKLKNEELEQSIGTGETREVAMIAARNRAKEIEAHSQVIRDLEIKQQTVRSENSALEDLRASIKKEIEEAKSKLHQTKTVETVEERLTRVRAENEEELRKRGEIETFDRLRTQIRQSELKLAELEERNRQGLIRKSDLENFDKLREDIVTKEARLNELIDQIREKTLTMSHFQSYEKLRKDVEDLEAMRRYLDSELSSRQSRVAELNSEIEALTIRRDRAYAEAQLAGSQNIPVPTTSTVATPVPIVQTRTPRDPWNPGSRVPPAIPIPARPPQVTQQPPQIPPRQPAPQRPRFGDLEID